MLKLYKLNNLSESDINDLCARNADESKSVRNDAVNVTAEIELV